MSKSHVDWKIIDMVASTTATGDTDQASVFAQTEQAGKPNQPERYLNAEQLLHNRRSAVSMDQTTTLNASDFYQLLQRLMPDPNNPTFKLFQQRTTVSLFLMVHRVTDLQPGLYVLVRNSEHLADLKEQTDKRWAWTQVKTAPPICHCISWPPAVLVTPLAS